MAPAFCLFLLLSMSFGYQVLAVKRGELRVRYHYYYSDRRCDGCCGDCEYRFYACRGTHCHRSENDISGSKGWHRGREVSQSTFYGINTQPWTMDYPGSAGVVLHVELWDVDGTTDDDYIRTLTFQLRGLPDSGADRFFYDERLTMAASLTCVSNYGGTDCNQCKSGWRGTTCNEIYCSTEYSQCRNRALCADDGCGHDTCIRYSTDSRRCSCNSGWTSSTCETDVNECLSNNGGCSDHCRNNQGSYSCYCRQYANLHLDGRRCTCRSGFIQNDAALTCDDIDECADNNGGCDHDCTNTPGSHICQCDPGYELHADLRMCLPICTGGCQNGGECVLPETCDCTTGWTGQNCETDIDECTNDISGCQQNCTNTIPGYFCFCGAGYTLNEDGHQCDDINECNITDNGGCHQICSNTPGSYKCSCIVGFVLGVDNNCTDVGVHQGLGSSGVAAVSGVAVSVIIASLVLCVVVVIVMKLRAPCKPACGKTSAYCKKPKTESDENHDSEVTPEDYGGFKLAPNPAYNVTTFATNTSKDGEMQPARGNDDVDVVKDNVYVVTKEEPIYGNFEMLY